MQLKLIILRCEKRHDDKFQKMFRDDPDRDPYERRYVQDFISIINCYQSRMNDIYRYN